MRRYFPVRPGQWLGPILAAGGVAALVGVLMLVSGVANLAASTPHPEGWAATLHYAFGRYVAFHSDGVVVPANLDAPEQVMKGAGYYATACAHCHGGPGLGQNPVAMSMRPQPQALAGVAATLSPQALFWIVKHGVKYSAMPAWPAQSRDDEVWAIVAFVRALPTMRYDRFRALAYNDAAGPSLADDPALALADPGRRRPYALDGRTQTGSTAQSDLSAPAFGFDSSVQSGNPLNTCARCHGRDGEGRAGGPYPKLTLQSATYLADSLVQFRSGRRRSAFMQTIAGQLSDRQIAALARHYAAQPAAAPAARPLDPLGQRIAVAGLPASRVAECNACHGATGAARAVPAIAGQGAWYVDSQLRLFRAGGRGGGGGEAQMVAAARNLTDPEIAALARYYASLPPGAHPVADARGKVTLH